MVDSDLVSLLSGSQGGGARGGLVGETTGAVCGLSTERRGDIGVDLRGRIHRIRLMDQAQSDGVDPDQESHVAHVQEREESQIEQRGGILILAWKRGSSRIWTTKGELE